MTHAPAALVVTFVVLNAVLAGGFAGTSRFFRQDWLGAIPVAFLTAVILATIAACNFSYRAGYRDGKAGS